MIHIENKTGKSYPICDMTDDHLLNTIELFVSRCIAMNKTSDSNPRYNNDIEQELQRLSMYYFEASYRDIINPMLKQKIEGMHYDYKRNRAEVFIPQR